MRVHRVVAPALAAAVILGSIAAVTRGHGRAGLVLATSAVGIAPFAVVVDARAARVVVANTMGNNVTILDAHSGGVLRTVAVGATPQALAAGSGRVFVATNDGKVRLIDIRSGALLAASTLGSNGTPIALALDAQSNSVFVACAGTGAAPSSIVQLDAGNGRIRTIIRMRLAPGPMVVDAATGTVFVADLGGAAVRVLDGQSGRLLHTTVLGMLPTAVAADPETGHVFVAQGSGPGSVSMLDGRSGAMLRTIPVGVNPQALAVDSRTGRVFVANTGTGATDGSVSVLDAKTGQSLRTVGMGRFPIDVAVDERTGRAFVVEGGDARVGVLDAATGAVVGSAAVARDPQRVEIDALTGHAFVVNLGSPSERPADPLARLGAWVRALLDRSARPPPVFQAGSVTMLDTSRQ